MQKEGKIPFKSLYRYLKELKKKGILIYNIKTGHRAVAPTYKEALNKLGKNENLEDIFVVTRASLLKAHIDNENKRNEDK